MPRLVHDKARKIQNKLAELEQRLGRPPSETEMARSLGSVPGGVSRLAGGGSAGGICLPGCGAAPGRARWALPHDSIADESQTDPSEDASRTELKELIAQRIRQLPPIQQKVLALYYFEDLRLREIAQAFGLTESRISQIHSQAILAIRSFIERQEALALGGRVEDARR